MLGTVEGTKRCSRPPPQTQATSTAVTPVSTKEEDQLSKRQLALHVPSEKMEDAYLKIVSELVSLGLGGQSLSKCYSLQLVAVISSARDIGELSTAKEKESKDEEVERQIEIVRAHKGQSIIQQWNVLKRYL